MRESHVSRGRLNPLRASIAVATAFVISVATVSCSTTPDNDAPTRSELIISQATEPRSLEPMQDLVKTSLSIDATVLEPLVGTSGDFQLVPLLATKWEQTSPTTFVFSLREGVSFSNGEPMNADAVVFSLETQKKALKSAVAGYFAIIDSAKALSPTQVQITTKSPSSTVPALMSLMYVYPPAYYAKVGGDEFGRAPIGTGPYVFDSWHSGQSITVVKNPDYWGKPGTLKKITWNWAADPQSQVAGLQTGGSDLAIAIPPVLADQVKAQSGLELKVVPSNRTAFLGMNTFDPNLKNPDLRKAIWQAIDRDSLAKNVVGIGGKVTSVIQSLGGVSSDDAGLPFDPSAARKLAKQAEPYAPIELHWPQNAYPRGDDAVQAIAGMLKDAGINVVLKPMETGSFWNLLLSHDAVGKMGGLFWTTNAPLYPDASQLMSAYFRSGTAQFLYCYDNKMDGMIDEAVAEQDPGKRLKMYQELNDYIVSEKLCWMPLYDQTNLYGMSDKLGGVVFRPDGFVDVTHATFKKP